ncbi:MAG TPA: hypothetical protein VIS06_13655 [Mycobacteriales bacterium]|jgi:hypothetical protein
MPEKKKANPRKQADRAMVDVDASQILGIRLRIIAGYLRQAGRSEKLTREQAGAWRDRPQDAPPWFAGMLAESAARQAQREAVRQRHELEREHRMLVLADQVERRLLAGTKHFRDPDSEFIASDLAFRAMKELVRNRGDASSLLDLDRAALRWAGVVPEDHGTWFLHSGNCCTRSHG